jgi:hypothetical protein
MPNGCGCRPKLRRRCPQREPFVYESFDNLAGPCGGTIVVEGIPGLQRFRGKCGRKGCRGGSWLMDGYGGGQVEKLSLERSLGGCCGGCVEKLKIFKWGQSIPRAARGCCAGAFLQNFCEGNPGFAASGNGWFGRGGYYTPNFEFVKLRGNALGPWGVAGVAGVAGVGGCGGYGDVAAGAAAAGVAGYNQGVAGYNQGVAGYDQGVAGYNQGVAYGNGYGYNGYNNYDVAGNMGYNNYNSYNNNGAYDAYGVNVSGNGYNAGAVMGPYGGQVNYASGPNGGYVSGPNGGAVAYNSYGY